MEELKLVCNGCKKPFKNEAEEKGEGRETGREKGKGREGECFEVGEVYKYHAKCFKCVMCNKLLEMPKANASLFLVDDTVHCLEYVLFFLFSSLLFLSSFSSPSHLHSSSSHLILSQSSSLHSLSLVLLMTPVM